MTTKIEQDAKRVNLYNAIDKNLEQIVLHKTNFDFLTKQVNDWMIELKTLVEDATIPEYTPEDFDAVLSLRDKKLAAIPVAEVVEFFYYAEVSPIAVEILTVDTPIIEEVII